MSKGIGVSVSECVVCGEETSKGEHWCDPCWVDVKAKCLAKFKESKDMTPEKSENAKVMTDALGTNGE